jgi:hypothetical protein
MKKEILDAVKELGELLAQESPELSEEELRDAIMTSHVLPDEIGEAFIVSFLEGLGLENNLEQRHDDRVQKLLSPLNEILLEALTIGRLPTEPGLRKLAGRLVKALYGDKNSGGS